ncbi:Nuclear transcription factor Y subunit C-4 [Astathelohania contejeani]|uniref:Nuclear transcription factor Y subunit C-4 n=1 Tax=Astathelohania contejeani TaxID=164912 RepID=A0ABQ7HX66_9MICR|nr:Nuclear transcription factor Y subunit C-4 [Thelohania contejeani]
MHEESKKEAKKTIEEFLINSLRKAETEPLDYKKLQLPLARIKRLMKVEEEVKMVASEVPILFSKVAEIFIEELTLRAWLNTEENKRRILQKNDLSAAVRTSDMFDFLIYIIPRNDMTDTINPFPERSYEESTYQTIPSNNINSAFDPREWNNNV